MLYCTDKGKRVLFQTRNSTRLGILFLIHFLYLIIFPKKPSDLVIAVVGVKMVNVSFDVFFLAQQKRILKTHHSAISETNYAAALASLLFDVVTLVSLLLIWLLRNSSISGYISPSISIFVSFYLVVGCFRRIKQALIQLHTLLS